MVKQVKKTIIGLLLLDAVLLLTYLLFIYVLPVIYQLPDNPIEPFIRFFYIIILINLIPLIILFYGGEK